MSKMPVKQNDVILSTKITVSRNLDGLKFPIKLDASGKSEVIKEVRDVLAEYPIHFEEVVPKYDKLNNELYSKKIVDRQFYEANQGIALFVSDDHELSVLVNDGEHIKIQCVLPGMDTQNCFVKANKLAVFLENKMNISYTESLGFLTSDIEKIGLGMNVTFLAVIPGLLDKNGIVGLSNIFEENYCKLIPFDNKDKSNPLYFLESRANLGIDENTLLKISDNLAAQFAAKERKARCEYLKAGEEIIENYKNDYYCGYGILKYGTLFSRKDIVNSISIFYIVQTAQPVNDETFLSWEQLKLLVSECVMSILALGTEEFNVLECRKKIAVLVKQILDKE
ncbi:MAG: hypothetical protein MJ153_01010 [Clostridia bacterium]|nr:hypothetical protein [Clostridia bacterium]